MFLFLFFFLFSSIINPSLQTNSLSLSFPLTSLSLPKNTSSKLLYTSQLFSTPKRNINNNNTQIKQPSYNYKFSFKYSMALIVNLPIGTPPQVQPMVLDTGSQLSWIQCHKKQPPTASFDPSLSSTFSNLPCTHPLCKPRIPDFTLPTSCDQNRLCHYSYFYADGTYAEGNLAREKFTFSRSVSTPPLILGCATESTDPRGILGMNLGRLSFAHQSRISKFSYCVPTRQTRPGFTPSGSFYIGNNPNSKSFKYIKMSIFPERQRMPNLDPLAYTIPLVGISIGGKKLSISPAVFRADAGGSGQTMIDSGSEFTYLVGEAYDKMRAGVVRAVGSRMKKDYVYGGVADMCFDSKNAVEIGRLIGEMVFEFERGVEVVIPKERVLADVGSGVHCVGIGNSDKLGAASNIIGNFHQQNLWVEFDLVNRRVGFGRAECSRLAK